MQATHKAPFVKRATAIGSYHESTLPKAALRQYLLDCSGGRFKTASLGGEQEQGFEQAFSSLAYAYLKDKSPRLLDFIVGFQLVDRNEDNTKAMGVFGFHVGDQWLYAPCFFLNGDLKGHELLYIKKQDAFVPMKENWVNYLISRRPHTLGEPSEKNTFELGGMMPNLSRLSRPPSGNKYGADEPGLVHVDDWAKPALPLIFALATKQAHALYPELVKGATDLNMSKVVDAPFKAAFAPYADAFDLRKFLSTFPLLKAAFEQCYMQYPLIKKGFDRFYGVNFFREMAEQVKLEADSLVTKVAESYIVPPKGTRLQVQNRGRLRKTKANPFSLIEEKEPEPKQAELVIIALDVDNDVPITVNKDELTEEERQKLLKDTVLIKDKRDPQSDKTSIAYNTQVKLELSNPSETGLYEVLEKPGSFDEMLIIANPHTGRGREDFCLVLRKSSPRNWLNAHRNTIWTKQCDCPVRADFEKYVDGLGGTDSLEKGGVYVAVHKNGSGTCPFRVKESYGDGVYKVDWKDFADFKHGRPGYLAKTDRSWDWEVGYSSWDAKIFINKRKGTGLRSVNGELSIPEDYKIVKVADPPKPKKDPDCLVSSCCCSEPLSNTEGSDEHPIQPGNLVDIQIYLQKNAHCLKVHDTGSGEVWLKSVRGHERMSKKAALISLVRDHGLTENQSRHILKEAAQQSVHNRSASYYIKYAQGGMGLQPGPSAPPFPEPLMGVEQHGPNATQSIYPQEEFQPVDEMSSQMTDPSIYDPFYQPDPQSMQVAQQAAMSGQKEVFDTAMISGMLKSVRQDSLVDRYLGDLMKALDKLGRILFMFYWHQEEFEDRYGKQDLPELEDSLRNAFEVLGDVCLFLQEKTVKGMSGMMGGVGSPSKGEPSVQEAARN